MDPTVVRHSTTADDVKSTAARNAGFPLVRFSAASNLTPELVRQKLIAEYRLARADRCRRRWANRLCHFSDAIRRFCELY
jgi:hypothetical protein